MSTQKTLRSVALAALTIVSVHSALAVGLITPVGPANFADTPLPGTTAASRPELAGTVLADTLQNFSFEGLTGTVQNRVVREDVSGTLDFYWKIDVASSTAGNAVNAFRLIDFGLPYLTDADWRIDGSGTEAPGTARLFNGGPYPTGAINFLFPTTASVGAGEQSRFFFLHTTATAFAQTAQYDLLSSSDGISGVFSTYAPAVPEPSSVALLLCGLAALGVKTLRKRA